MRVCLVILCAALVGLFMVSDDFVLRFIAFVICFVCGLTFGVAVGRAEILRELMREIRKVERGPHVPMPKM